MAPGHSLQIQICREGLSRSRKQSNTHVHEANLKRIAYLMLIFLWTFSAIV